MDVEHSTVLRVQVNFNDALTDCGDYDEERIKYLLSNSYERRTFEKARSFSLDDVKISVVLNTGTDLKQILLGETNYTFKGYGTIKYKIVNAQELEIKLLETLVTAGGGS